MLAVPQKQMITASPTLCASLQDAGRFSIAYVPASCISYKLEERSESTVTR